MKDYHTLQRELEELLDARDNENNPEMLADIDVHITQVRAEIERYPLADDDLFRCVHCKQVFDIEDSCQGPDGLYCSYCVNIN